MDSGPWQPVWSVRISKATSVYKMRCIAGWWAPTMTLCLWEDNSFFICIRPQTRRRNNLLQSRRPQFSCGFRSL